MSINREQILVTGGTGFLGQYLVRRLLGLEYQVTVLGRNEVIGKVLAQQGAQFIQADLKETAVVTEACQGQDYIFHCGALSSPWGRYADFYNANVLGTKNIIAGAQKYQVKRVIHVSSTSIYNDHTDKFKLSEQAPLPKKFMNLYAATKFMAEQEIDQAHREGLGVITIRPSGIFGPGDNAILPRLIRVNQQRFIPKLTEEKIYIDITYVENVVDALLLCKDSPAKTLGKKYNITNDEPISLYDFLGETMAQLGYPYRIKRLNLQLMYQLATLMELSSRTIFDYREPLLTRYMVALLSTSRTLEITAAKQDLNYQPRISVAEGLAELVKWWRATHDS